MRKNLSNHRDREGHHMKKSLLEFCSMLKSFHIHGEDGGHGVNRSYKDSNLTDPNCEQQPPGGLPVGLPLAEDLRQPENTESFNHRVNEVLTSQGSLAYEDPSARLHASIVCC